MKTFVHLLLVLLAVWGCSNASKPSTNEAEVTTTENSPVEITTEEAFALPQFLDTASLNNLMAIKTVFEEFICDGISASPNNKNCYLTHAQSFAYDFMNDIPYTLNFPYDGTFDLSQVENEANGLSFLTKNCGFQDQSTGEVIHYHCMKAEGAWMDYLEYLGQSTDLIGNIQLIYKEAKTINSNIKQRLTLGAANDLDFGKEDHQIFYMMMHLLINEERIASEKIANR